MNTNFICPRCGNSHPKYIGYLNGKPYCRFCISMKGKEAKKDKSFKPAVVTKLNYKLSREQSFISRQLIKNYNERRDTLVNAVCGAGKTELVFGVIAHCISIKKSVAFAVPRRDVAIELYQRIHAVFAENRVVLVCGGHNDKLEGEIVVLTTHQLYRYDHYFDLIILDEIDAFPFKNNQLLSSMFFRAIKGPIIMMSATPSDDVIKFFYKKNRKILELNTRFHRHPLPVPNVIQKIGFLKIIFTIKQIKKYVGEGKKVFVFAPTIDKCEKIEKFLGIFVKNGTFIHSKCKNRSELIKNFKNGKYDYFVTTAVLERGVTFKNLQVIIYDADNEMYDSQTLIQISGRVGRKIDAPEGEVIFLVNKETEAIKDAISTIKRKNESLQNMLSTN